MVMVQVGDFLRIDGCLNSRQRETPIGLYKHHITKHNWRHIMCYQIRLHLLWGSDFCSLYKKECSILITTRPCHQCVPLLN